MIIMYFITHYGPKFPGKSYSSSLKAFCGFQQRNWKKKKKKHNHMPLVTNHAE